MYALVLAGGSGTRLWPHSRSSKPKQFLNFNGQTTMLQETVNRTLSIIPLEQVFVATGAAYVDLVAEQLPDVPRENILAEPSGRGTAPCIGWGALHLLRRDPNAVMAVLSADHVVERGDLFCEQLLVGEAMAREGRLVTIGITPTAPSTGYGYIQCGDVIHTQGDNQVLKIAAFVEKPNAERAAEYLASGSFLWNAGMFVWRADRILEELQLHRPALAEALALIDQAIGTAHERSVLQGVWHNIENVAIDVAVMEQTTDACVVPSNIGWSDVGDWAALADTLGGDNDGNAVVGTHIGVDTANTMVYGNGRLVATIGIDNLLIIDTPDALLICARERTQDVKKIVAQLKEHNHGLL